VKIISHRGFWLNDGEKNDMVAFERTVKYGFGTETDFRDLNGKLVISHDPPLEGALKIETVLDVFRGKGLTIAVNVKSDGNNAQLKQILEAYEQDYFTFDMSIPQMVQFVANGMPVYTRHSDVETHPVMYDKAAGVWLDAFFQDWYGETEIRSHLDAGKPVCLVSPELHKRDPFAFWAVLKGAGLHECDRLTLCTDLPTTAAQYFDETL
jgi:hypothetical protein